MKLPLMIVRPLPDAHVTAARAQERGFEAHIAPLFEVVPVEWQCPDPRQLDALIVTSKNALRFGGDQLSELRKLPVYAVGESTAELAREHGFAVATVSRSGLAGLLLPPDKRFLRLAGKDYLPLTENTRGSEVKTAIVYDSRRREPDAAAMKPFGQDNIALCHSARAATALRETLEQRQLDLCKTRIAAISARVAEVAAEGWGAVEIADEPTDAALLDAAARLCL